MGHAIARRDTQTRPVDRPERARQGLLARILIVEDEPVTAEVFARALRQQGHEVRVARDGLQALRALREEPPELVILDLGLPSLPGLEVLRRLREGSEPGVPVIVVSGVGPQALPAAAQLLVPGRWLGKPLRPRDLVAAVAELRSG